MTGAQIEAFLPQAGFSDLEESFFASEIQDEGPEDFHKYKAPLLSRLATQIADFLDSGRLPARQ